MDMRWQKQKKWKKWELLKPLAEYNKRESEIYEKLQFDNLFEVSLPALTTITLSFSGNFKTIWIHRGEDMDSSIVQ